MSAKHKVLIISLSLNAIVEKLCNSPHEVVGIVQCPPRNISKISNFLRKLAEYSFTIKSLKFFCMKKRIPFVVMDKGCDQALEHWIKTKNPDVIITYSMSQLLKENIFTIPTLGTLNLHPSYLPSYRGPNPWFWMYYNQDEWGGITVHFIDKGEDTGDILLQKKYEIEAGIKFPELNKFVIDKLGVDLILEALDRIGELVPVKQVESSPTARARNIKGKEHGDLIRWSNWPIERVWHLMRGTEGWLKCIEQPRGVLYGQRWEVQGYEKCSVPDHLSLGSLHKKGNETCVVCHDGFIKLRARFRLRSFLVALYKRFSK